jgi:hypothetical protein
MSRGGGPSITKKLPPGKVTFAGLEKATGVSRNTLRRWHREGDLVHSATIQKGSITVYLFDLDSMVSVVKTRAQKAGGTQSTANPAT